MVVKSQPFGKPELSPVAEGQVLEKSRPPSLSSLQPSLPDPNMRDGYSKVHHPESSPLSIIWNTAEPSAASETLRLDANGQVP